MIDSKDYYFFTNGISQYYVFKVLEITSEGDVYVDIFLASKPQYINNKGDNLADLKIVVGSEIFEQSNISKYRKLEIFRYIFESNIPKLTGTYNESDFRGTE